MTHLTCMISVTYTHFMRVLGSTLLNINSVLEMHKFHNAEFLKTVVEGIIGLTSPPLLGNFENNHFPWKEAE